MPEPPQLIDLLPAVYRVRDAAQGGPLAALLGVVQAEADRVRDDIAGLYANWFIETCDEWVVPYIGDLLGVTGLSPTGNAGFSQRGFVANTIGYRRRKGTAAVLEALGRDITGWPARAVEFFELLKTTQHLNHVRTTAQATASLRDASALEAIDGPFATFAHTAEVRHIDNARGRYDIANVGVFLWRIGAYPLTRSTARAVTGQAGLYRFSPLALDQPLFNYQRSTPDPDARVVPSDLPAPLDRRQLFDELVQLATPGPTPPASGYLDAVVPVLTVWLDGSPVPTANLSICDLADETRRAPTGTTAAVDPERGRLALAEGSTPATSVEVSWAYGFPAEIGGGPYDRQASLTEWIPEDSAITWQKGVGRDAATDTANLYGSISEAVTAWNALPVPLPLLPAPSPSPSPAPAGSPSRQPQLGVIAVMDNRSYAGDLAVTVPAGATLILTAADWPTGGGPATRRNGDLAASQLRPHIAGNLVVTGAAATGSEAPGQLIVDGLLIEGSVTVAPGGLGRLCLSNCTIVPSAGGLTVAPGTSEAEGNVGLEVDVWHSIVGPVQISPLVQLLSVRDSILDGTGGAALTGPPTVIATSTVFGTSTPETLQASSVIFDGTVTVARRQEGCVRYSYVTPGSTVPRRFRCSPTAGDPTPVVPQFNSSRYGDADYGQLAATCSPEIAAGAEDGGEMGAYNLLRGAYRLASLRAGIDEYLRFGLEAGILFAT